MLPARLIVLVLFVAAVLFGALPVFAGDVPGAPQSRPIALIGATIHPVDAPVIEKGTLLFDQGKIKALGTSIAIPENAETVQLDGYHVYPVLIGCGTQIGLVEIGAVRATRDQSEVGEINPNVRAEASVNPDSELIPVTRSSGVAIVQTMPSGGLISGSSALIRLDGWTWEDLVVAAPLGIHVQWPTMNTQSRGRDQGADAANRRKEERDRQLSLLSQTFANAKAYTALSAEQREGAEIDLRSEALAPVVRGEKPVFLHANAERDILAAVRWALAEKLRPVVVGGLDAPRITSFLKENKVPVIYGPVHSLPRNRADAFDTPFTGPLRLFEAGVSFAIAAFETSNARNLPYHAATAAAYGLPPEEALRAITLRPAQILGVADQLGSLAIGKAASLMVTDGDPLEITTQVRMLWLEGRTVDLSNRHTDLYDKYSERLRRGEGKPARRF